MLPLRCVMAIPDVSSSCFPAPQGHGHGFHSKPYPRLNVKPLSHLPHFAVQRYAPLRIRMEPDSAAPAGLRSAPGTFAGTVPVRFHLQGHVADAMAPLQPLRQLPAHGARIRPGRHPHVRGHGRGP